MADSSGLPLLGNGRERAWDWEGSMPKYKATYHESSFGSSQRVISSTTKRVVKLKKPALPMSLLAWLGCSRSPIASRKASDRWGGRGQGCTPGKLLCSATIWSVLYDHVPRSRSRAGCPNISDAEVRCCAALWLVTVPYLRTGTGG